MAMNRPEWKHAMCGCLSAAFYGAVQPLNAYVVGSMVSMYFLTSHDKIREKTRIYVLVFVGLALFVFLTNIVQHYSFAYMGENLTKRIREKMLTKMLTFEVNWFDEGQNSSGAACSRLAKEANLVRSLIGERVSLLVQTISGVAIACTLGLVIAWRLAIVMIAVQPVIVVCFYTQRILLKSMSKKAIKAQDESCKLAAEAVSNIRTIIAFSTGRAIADAGTMTTDLAKGSDAVGSVFAVLDRCTTIEPEDPNGYLPEKIKGIIRFVNVDFAYPTRPNVVIFKDFSIEIEEGKSTAIVGPSGSGRFVNT
ncbi:unnamed protein product [Brassica rapa subsp. trilocularis]